MTIDTYLATKHESEAVRVSGGSPWDRLALWLKRKPSSDVLWLVGSQAAIAAGQLAGVRVITECVRPEVYGTVSIILGLVVFGRSQFALPFAMAAMRKYAEAERRDAKVGLVRVIRYWLVRAQGLAAFLVLAFGFPYCYVRSISLWLPTLALGLFLVDSEIMVESSLLNASQRHRAYSLLRGSEAWIRPLLAVLMVYLFGPTAVVVLLGYLVATFLLIGVVVFSRPRRSGVASGPVDRELIMQVWRFCLPLFPIAPVEWVSSLSDRYIIGALSGMGAAGIYAAAYGLISQPFLMAGVVIENYYRPHYYNALADREPANAQRIFARWFAMTAAVGLLGLVGVVVLKSWVTSTFLAESYRNATNLLFPIALGNAFFALGHVTERFLYGKERTDLCLVSRTIGAIVSLAAGIPMIYFYGAEGAAWAVPVYYGCQLATALYIVQRVEVAGRATATLSEEESS